MVITDVRQDQNEIVEEASLLAAIDQLGTAEAYLQDAESREQILSALFSAVSALEQAPEWNLSACTNMAKLYHLSANLNLDEIATTRITTLVLDQLTRPASLILARRMAANPCLSQQTYELLLLVCCGDTGVKHALAANPFVGNRVLKTLLLEDGETAGIVMANPGCSVHLRESAPLGIKAQFETEMADVICEIASASTPEDFASLRPRLDYALEPMDVTFATNRNLPEEFREVLTSRGGAASWIIINNTHSDYYAT